MRRFTWKQALLPLGLWTLLVLFFSTRTEVRGEPFVWIPITWGQALKISLAQWSAWGGLALLIIWIDRRLPVERDALFRRFLFHVPLSVIFTVAYTYLEFRESHAPRRTARRVADGGRASRDVTWRVIHRNGTFFYWVIVGTYIAVDYQNHLKNRLVRTAELERLLSDARLNVLRTQLQPHFLFNALNAISAHIESEPRTARLMLERLGDLLRLSLDHIDQQEIGLDQELAFIERYLQLQAMRFEDRLNISMNVEPEARDALVPPFILQPLVENAVQHGAAARSANGTIAVEAWRDNGRVRSRRSRQRSRAAGRMVARPEPGDRHRKHPRTSPASVWRAESKSEVFSGTRRRRARRPQHAVSFFVNNQVTGCRKQPHYRGSHPHHHR